MKSTFRRITGKCTSTGELHKQTTSVVHSEKNSSESNASSKKVKSDGSLLESQDHINSQSHSMPQKDLCCANPSPRNQQPCTLLQGFQSDINVDTSFEDNLSSSGVDLLSDEEAVCSSKKGSITCDSIQKIALNDTHLNENDDDVNNSNILVENSTVTIRNKNLHNTENVEFKNISTTRTASTDQENNIQRLQADAYTKGFEDGIKSVKQNFKEGSHHISADIQIREEKNKLNLILHDREYAWAQERDKYQTEIYHLRRMVNKLAHKLEENQRNENNGPDGVIVLPESSYNQIYKAREVNERALCACVEMQRQINQQKFCIFGKEQKILQLEVQVLELQQQVLGSHDQREGGDMGNTSQLSNQRADDTQFMYADSSIEEVTDVDQQNNNPHFDFDCSNTFVSHFLIGQNITALSPARQSPEHYHHESKATNSSK